MDLWEALLLIGAGFVAGTINTLAGGASALTVPLLVLLGLPGSVANGTNRVGIFVQCLWAALRFRAAGFSGFRASLPILLPACVGATLGAWWISSLADRTFEQLFAIVMLAMLAPMLRGRFGVETQPRVRKLSSLTNFALFFLIGAFGGAFQVGVGLLLLAALNYLGHDIVRANSVKVVVNLVLTGIVVPIFVLRGHVAWLPALFLGIGFVLGGSVGVHLAVHRGARAVRPALAVAIVILAGKLLGLY